MNQRKSFGTLLSGRIVDPLSGRIAGTWCVTVQKIHKLSLSWLGRTREGGCNIENLGGAQRAQARLLPNGVEKCRTIYVCIGFCVPCFQRKEFVWARPVSPYFLHGVDEYRNSENYVFLYMSLTITCYVTIRLLGHLVF